MLRRSTDPLPSILRGVEWEKIKIQNPKMRCVVEWICCLKFKQVAVFFVYPGACGLAVYKWWSDVNREKRITMAMAVLSSSLPPLSNPLPTSTSSSNLCCPRIYSSSSSYHLRRRLLRPLIASQLCAPQTFKIDKSSLVVAETVSEDQLWAAACLRIRSFYQFGPSYGIDVSVDFIGFCRILAILVLGIFILSLCCDRNFWNCCIC